MTKFANKRKASAFPIAKARNRYGRDGRCVWCGITTRKTIGAYPRPTDPTREHLIPRSAGGGGGRNLALACRRCNNRRGQNQSWIPWELVRGRKKGVAYRWDGDVYVAMGIHVHIGGQE